MGRKHRYRRDGEKGKESIYPIRSLDDKFAVGLHDLHGLIEWPEGWPGINHLDGLPPKEERSNDSKIPAPASYGPKKIGVFLRARGHKSSIGQNHVHAEQVINGQTITAREIADAASERQAAYAGGGDEPARHSQPE